MRFSKATTVNLGFSNLASIAVTLLKFNFLRYFCYDPIKLVHFLEGN
jgi:hypothetical protein